MTLTKYGFYLQLMLYVKKALLLFSVTFCFVVFFCLSIYFLFNRFLLVPSVITQHPSPAAVDECENVSLSCTATGSPPSQSHGNEQNHPLNYRLAQIHMKEWPSQNQRFKTNCLLHYLLPLPSPLSSFYIYFAHTLRCHFPYF